MILEKNCGKDQSTQIFFVNLRIRFVIKKWDVENLRRPKRHGNAVLIKAIKSFLQKLCEYTKYIDNQINVTKSVRQGGVVSSFLVMLLMDICTKFQLWWFRRQDKELIILAYVEDIVLITKSLIMLQNTLKDWINWLNRGQNWKSMLVIEKQW